MSDTKEKSALSVVSLPRSMWWLRELTAAIVWLALFTHILVVDVGDFVTTWSPVLAPIVQYRLLALLMVAAVLLLMLGYRKFTVVCLYIIAYPAMVITWRIPKLLFRNWAVVIAFSPAVYNLATAFRVSFLVSVVALVSAFIVCAASPESGFVLIGMVAVGAFLVFHYFHRFRMAYSASTVFSDLHEGIANGWQELRNSIRSGTAEQDGGSDARDEQGSQRLLQEYMLVAAAYFIISKLEMVAESRKLDAYFVCSLLWTFFVTVVAFAVLYFGLYRVSPENFSGAQNSHLIDFVGFSFGTLMTARISSISPVGEMAQLLAYAELFGSLMILILLVFIVLTSIRERYRQDLQKLTEEIGITADNLRSEIESQYGDTIEGVERILVRQFESSMKMVLRLRYSQDRAVEIVDDVLSDEERTSSVESEKSSPR